MTNQTGYLWKVWIKTIIKTWPHIKVLLWWQQKIKYVFSLLFFLLLRMSAHLNVLTLNGVNLGECVVCCVQYSYFKFLNQKSNKYLWNCTLSLLVEQILQRWQNYCILSFHARTGEWKNEYGPYFSDFQNNWVCPCLTHNRFSLSRCTIFLLTSTIFG